MPVFFDNFPTLDYTKGNEPTKTLTNVFRRMKPIENIMKDIRLYYDYTIQDEQKPFMVSHEFYGTVDYEWIILLFNQIHDPFFQWPLSNSEFDRFIEKKYGSHQNALQKIKHYEQIVQPHTKTYDGNVVQEKTIVIDRNTYFGLDDFERKIVYCFDYEMQLNEARRHIRIPDPIYIPQILQEKKKIFE